MDAAPRYSRRRHRRLGHRRRAGPCRRRPRRRRTVSSRARWSLVDHDRSAALYDTMPAGIEVSGGSAANTAAGIASLGGGVAFIGKVRDDALGEIFTHDLRSTGVVYTTPPGTSGPPTARCLVLVTPDAERTMSTYLGTAGELVGRRRRPGAGRPRPASPTSRAISSGCPAPKARWQAAMKAAHAAGRKVALTLSDPALGAASSATPSRLCCPRSTSCSATRPRPSS